MGKEHKNSSLCNCWLGRMYAWFSFELTYTLGATAYTPIGLCFFHLWGVILVIFMVLFPSFIEMNLESFLKFSIASWIIATIIPPIVFEILPCSEKIISNLTLCAGDDYIKKIDKLKRNTHPILVVLICVFHILFLVFLFLFSLFQVVGII
ncbi:MAG: hypothetical protein PUB29_02135 [Bacteroidales bacterium]|nr:hypothetical protein [Bacteroidales bacterium]